MTVRRAHLLALSLLVGGAAAAAPGIDPFAPKARLDLLGPLHADATPNPPPAKAKPAPATAGSVPIGGACSVDDECAGRAYCDLGQCIPLQRRTSALIYYHQPGDKGYRILLPFYYHWWSRDGNGRIVFPLYWHFHDYQTAEEDTFVFLYQRHLDPHVSAHRVWPLFFYSQYGKDGRDGSGVGLLPIFWASRDKTKQTGAAPLLLTGWTRDSANGDYRALVLGLSYFQRRGDSTFAMVFPLVWHAGDRDASTTVVLPLGVFGHDKKRGFQHATVVPLFHWNASDDGKHKTVVTPLGGYVRDDDERSRTFVAVAPPIYSRHDARRNLDVFFPIALHYRDKIDRSATTVVGPYFHYSDGTGWIQSLLPLVWLFHDRPTHATTGFVFPVAAWHSSPTVGAGLVGPFYGYRGPGGWAGGVFPLLFLQDLDGRSHQALLPLFLHARDAKAGTSTTALFPAYWRTARDGWDAGVLPVAFAGRHGDARYGVAFPLYYYRGDKHGSTHVLGPLYASVHDDRYAIGAAPLFHVGRTHFQEGDGHTSWFAPPLWFHTDDPRTQTSFSLIGPAFRATSGRDTTQGVFPLAWGFDRGPQHVDLVLPLFAHVRNDERKTDHWWVGPFVRLHDGTAQSTTNIFVPLLVDHQAPGYHVTVQFPFFWRVKEGDETDTVVFPFYGRMRKPGLAVDVAFPLVWRVNTATSRTLVIGPFFRTGHDDRSDFALLPLFGGGGTRDRHYAWALPLLLWHSSDDKTHESRTIVGPFFHDSKPGEWTDSLLPLWVAWRRGSQTHFVSPLYYHSGDSSTGAHFDLFGPFYYGSDPHGRSAGLIPLLFTRTHDDGRWSATFVPLFHAARKADGGLRVLTLPFGFATSPTGARGYVGPIYFRRDAEGYSAALIPLFYHSHDNVADSTTTFVLPLFLRASTPERTLLAVTPLAWHYRTIEQSTTIALTFFDRHEYGTSRTTGFLPLYIRHKSFVDGSSTQIFPLTYVRARPNGPTDFVLFPLLWSVHGAESSSTTVLFPLFWHVRRGSSTTTVLFPFYLRAVRETANYTVVLNFYYRSGKGAAAGSYYWNLFPLFDFGRPRPQDLEWSVLGGLFGYSRIGHNRTLKLLYGIEIALEPAPLASTASGTMFTSNPSLRGGLF